MIIIMNITILEVIMFKVNSSLSKSNIPRTIRFSEETYNSLFEIAEIEQVSFNSLVLQCCSYAINDYEKIDLLRKRKNKDRE